MINAFFLEIILLAGTLCMKEYAYLLSTEKKTLVNLQIDFLMKKIALSGT